MITGPEGEGGHNKNILNDASQKRRKIEEKTITKSTKPAKFFKKFCKQRRFPTHFKNNPVSFLFVEKLQDKRTGKHLNLIRKHSEKTILSHKNKL